MIVVMAVFSTLFSGCSIIEGQLFPIWPPNDFASPPAQLGPYSWVERRVEGIAGADGETLGITIFEPQNGSKGGMPAMIWTMGSNVQGYYHQSLHENLASWGYAVVIPDTRPLRFTDFQYHNNLVLLAIQAMDLALDGSLGISVNPAQTAFGGYSIGGPLAAFSGARDSRADALVYWAPSGSPIWQGVTPDDLFPDITQDALYILGSLDITATVTGFPLEMQEKSVNSTATVEIIEGATHLQFMQPDGADDRDPDTDLTREEQHEIAINLTREWLDEQFGIEKRISPHQCKH